MHPVSRRMTGRERLKLLMRRVAAAILFYSGINAVYRLLARRSQPVILMYHRIIDPADVDETYLQPGMYVTKESFEMQMEHLSRRYHVVGLERLIEGLKNGKGLNRNSCVITFDDGWQDNYIHAFPILKKYKLPAIVFLVSQYVGTDRWFWPEKVSFLLARFFERKKPGDFRSNVYPALKRIDFSAEVSNPHLTQTQKIESIIEILKGLEQAEIEKTIHELEDLLNINPTQDYSKPLLLSWDEVTEMSRSVITFGSHTKSHAILTKVSKKEATGEIVESKQEIEKRLSKPCQAFCYPNGDCDEEIKGIVMKHYSCALTVEHGFVKPGDDLFGLKRFGIHNDISFTKAMFACRISGVLDILGL